MAGCERGTCAANISLCEEHYQAALAEYHRQRALNLIDTQEFSAEAYMQAAARWSADAARAFEDAR